jgi:hypothetical protein
VSGSQGSDDNRHTNVSGFQGDGDKSDSALRLLQCCLCHFLFVLVGVLSYTTGLICSPGMKKICLILHLHTAPLQGKRTSEN